MSTLLEPIQIMSLVIQSVLFTVTIPCLQEVSLRSMDRYPSGYGLLPRTASSSALRAPSPPFLCSVQKMVGIS